MTVYVLAQITIHDRARYERYVAGFMPVLMAHGGRLLAADEGPERIEGDWPFDKAILIAFPDAARMRAWADSPAYRAIASDRLGGTTGPVLMLHGIDPAQSGDSSGS